MIGPELFHISHSHDKHQALPCAHVMSLNYTERCDFITKTAECHVNRHFFDYLDFVFCTIGNKGEYEYWGGIILVSIICFYLFITLAKAADQFFCPVLAVISKILGLSENLAGVTLLAFGNGSPDLFTSLSNVSKDDTELMYTQLIGGATFVTGFVIGIIMIIRPSHIPPRTYIRDVLFFLTAAVFISNSTHDQGYTLIEGIITVSIYILYLGTVIIDHYYMKRQMKNILEIKEAKSSEEREELEKKAEDLESILDFQIRSRKDSSIIIDDVEIIENVIVPEKLTVGANKFLWKKFVQSITPIKRSVWIEGNWFERIYMILQAPVQVTLTLIIPIVDYSEELHGWSKLLNMINVIILPQACLLSIHQSNTKIFPFLPLWSIVLAISISLVVAIFVTTRNDCPPKWHIAFAAGSFAGSILVIYNVAKEVVSVMTAVGIISDMSDSFVGLSILAWGNSIGDAFANIALARQGYQQMAFAACFGGPMFNTLLGIGLTFIFKALNSEGNLAVIREGAMGPNCIVFLCTILSFTLIALLFTNFQARKSIGIYCISMYFLFIFYCLLGELEIMHPYGTDHHRT